jgi:hypothetical protein
MMILKCRCYIDFDSIISSQALRLSQGAKICKICRSLGISEQSYYRSRRLYGGLKVTRHGV